jgi:hypothetical protein
MADHYEDYTSEQLVRLLRERAGNCLKQRAHFLVHQQMVDSLKKSKPTCSPISGGGFHKLA